MTNSRQMTVSMVNADQKLEDFGFQLEGCYQFFWVEFLGADAARWIRGDYDPF